LPLLEKTQAKMAAAGGTVLGINTRDASEDARGFVRKYDLTFPSLRDGSGDFAEKWGLTGYPESFLLDKEGRVAAARHGPIDQAWVDQNVLPLLQKDA
jgi:cytochrome c biogenesis protein CcmG/thiol:disulfide interchange protein DsbE